MSIRRTVLTLAAMMTATAVWAASPATIVDRFLPEELKTRADNQPVRAAELQRVFVITDLDHSGRQLIVALYTNNDDAILEVLSPEGEGSLIAANDDVMPGGIPKLEIRDLNGDGRPEIIARIAHPRGGELSWIYRWTGSDLIRLKRNDSSSQLDDDIVDATFVDLNGDGILEAVEHTVGRVYDEDGNGHYVAGYRVLSLSGNSYNDSSPADLLALFTRGKSSKPRASKRSFTVDDPDIPRRLLLVNGAPDGARASSAVVKLNGQSIFSEKDFNQTAGRLEAPVTVVSGQNELSVELRGSPGSKVTIIILPKSGS